MEFRLIFRVIDNFHDFDCNPNNTCYERDITDDFDAEELTDLVILDVPNLRGRFNPGYIIMKGHRYYAGISSRCDKTVKVNYDDGGEIEYACSNGSKRFGRHTTNYVLYAAIFIRDVNN